jgi:hypothetical protein
MAEGEKIAAAKTKRAELLWAAGLPSCCRVMSVWKEIEWI